MTDLINQEYEQPEYNMEAYLKSIGLDPRLSEEDYQPVEWYGIKIPKIEYKRKMATRAWKQRRRKLVKSGLLPACYLPEDHPRGNHPLAPPPNTLDNDKINVIQG